MTDSHAHLTFPQITSNMERILDEFVGKGGKHLLNMGHTPEANSLILAQFLELKERYPGLLNNAVGIHPEYVLDMLADGEKRYNQLEKIMIGLDETIEKHCEIISAVGECGLDYYQIQIRPEISQEMKEEIIELQRYLFRRHVEIALKHDLPMSIHTRDEQGSNQCVEDTLRIISDIGKGMVKGSFHSYTQDPQFIPQITSLGFYIGINGISTYPKADNVREIIRNVPLNKMLLETDTPLLPPQKVRKDRKFWRSFGAPADIDEVAQQVADVLDILKESVISKTDENYESLFLIN